ncbi:MAG: S8 family serine peptidase [Candidatus Cloacimonadia bacterium]
MKKILIIVSLFTFASLNCLWGIEPSPYELIVRFQKEAEIRGTSTGINRFDSIIGEYKVKSISPILEKNDFYIYHIECAKKLDFERLANHSKNSTEIAYIQPNYLNEFCSIIPNDLDYYKQWGLPIINAEQAWEIETGNEQIVIGLIDSGVDYTHPDLTNNIWINHDEIPGNGIDDDGNGFVDDWQGWDFTDTNIPDAMGDCQDRDNDPMDDLGHGTQCAGIIAAETNNNLGIAGTSWHCKIMPLRAGFKTEQGVGYLEDDDVSAAIVYAAENGAQIISISWGDTQLSPLIRDGCEYATQMGVVIVASAGNESEARLMYPAAFNNVISVTAIDENSELCTFSSYGEGLDLCAPGLNIYSTTLGGGYEKGSGTSFTSPFVVGAIGLLLSYNPSLSHGRVTQLLYQSCQDLGLPGYDSQFGYGLLDVERLLLLANLEEVPKAEISFPSYGEGFSEDFPVIGTAFCPDFFRYSVMYTTSPNPDEGDWLDVLTHNQVPEYYENIVLNDTLANFNIFGIEDSTYYLRVAVYDKYGNQFVDIIKIYIDQSPPEFVTVDNNLAIAPVTRYDFDRKRYYITASTNEPVQFLAKCFLDTPDSFAVIDNKFSSSANLPLPEYLPSAGISFYLEATNRSGLKASSPLFESAINVDNATVPTSGFEKTITYPKPGFCCPNEFDIDGNGKQELIFMEIPQEGLYGPVRLCEKEQDSLKVVHTMPINFQPWSTGDSNGDGKIELLGSIIDSIFVYEAGQENSFPEIFVDGLSGFYGGVSFDIDSDGNDELLLRSTDTFSANYKIYRREGEKFVYSGQWLLNTTSVKKPLSRNQLTEHPQFGDLTHDGNLNILLSDEDGDILIYEVIDGNVNLRDTLTIPIFNALYTGIGDLDADGQNEFVVGGYTEDILDLDNQFWKYFVFKYNDQGEPVIISDTEISGVASLNGICITDLDPENDNGDEVIIIACPEAYIYKLQGHTFKPVWVGEAYRSPYPATLDLDNNGVSEVAFNQYDELDSLRMVIYQYPDDLPEISMPQDFRAIPINGTKVRLTWNAVAEADSYRVYRRLGDRITTFSVYPDLITPVEVITFIDSFSIHPDYDYFYQVSAFQNEEESYRTVEKHVVPAAPPLLQEVEMKSLNALQIDFDSSLNQSSENPANFELENYGFPVSVIRTNSEQSLLLTFESVLKQEDSPYLLSVQNLAGLYNTPIPDTIVTFEFKQDVERPAIVGSELVAGNMVTIRFSEAVTQATAENKENYLLIFPEDANHISIKDIALNDNKIEVCLTLSESLKPAKELYFIRVNNIEDLAGNVILPGKNIVKIFIPIKNLDYIIVYPNPVVPNSGRVIFDNLPTSGKVKIYIYDFAGNLVKSLSDTQLSQSMNRVEWDLRNDAGREISSGVYFYLIKYSDDYKNGKISVVR